MKLHYIIKFSISILLSAFSFSAFAAPYSTQSINYLYSNDQKVLLVIHNYNDIFGNAGKIIGKVSDGTLNGKKSFVVAVNSESSFTMKFGSDNLLVLDTFDNNYSCHLIFKKQPHSNPSGYTISLTIGGASSCNINYVAQNVLGFRTAFRIPKA